MKTKDIQDQLTYWYSPNTVNQYRLLQLIMMGYGLDESDIKKNNPELLSPMMTTSAGAGALLYFPPILRSFDQMRQSNPILKNMRILASQIRGVDVVPDWQGVPNYQNDARKAWWNQRSKGSDGYAAFKNDTDSAFLDFAMLGVGYLRVCVNTYEDGQRATAKYVSPLDVISDPYRDIDDSEGVGVISLMGRGEFESKFEGKDFDQYRQTFFNPAGYISQAVRVIEWYSKDKYVAFPDQFTNEPILESENPYGCIPLQSYANFKPSGALLPMGLIEQQLSSAIDIVSMTSDIRNKSRNDGFVAIEPGFFTPESLKRYSETKLIEYLQIDSEKARALYQIGARPFIEIPRVGTNPDVMNLLNIAITDNREQSAVSASAAGVSTAGDATATEVRSIDNRMDSQYRALLRTFTRSHAGFAVKLAKVAEKYDNAPFTMSYKGASISFNDGNPNRTSELVWTGAKIPLFEDESLFSQDAAARIAQESAKYDKIFAMTQSPEAMKDAIEALGIENPDKYLPQAPPMGAEMPMGPEMLPQDLGGQPPSIGA
jgi:hypothetical protein